MAAALVVAALSLPSLASAEVVPARSAADFRDSIGVNTHIVYFDTAYADWPRVVQKLDTLGVDHLRDGIYGNPGWRDWNNRYYGDVDLAVAHGKHFDFIVGRPNNDSGTLEQLIAVASGRLRGAAEALEAPNEYDVSGDANWASDLRAYQQSLYAEAKADPDLRGLPVIGPSLVLSGSRAQLGLLDGSLDDGNLHPYSGGQAPSQAHLQDEAALAARVSGSRPLYATEAGFHNAMAATSGQPPVSEQVAADYLLRTYLEHFRAGIVRTYAYELIDEKPDPGLTDPEQHFGLLRNDFSEKPAFTALQRLLALVGRPADVTPAPLDLSLGGDTQGVQRLLLEKAPGSYTLVLWQSASEWDTSARREIAVAPRAVTVGLPTAATVTVARPARSAGVSALPGAQTQLALQVPADPLVVDIDFGPGDPGALTAVAPPTARRAAPKCTATRPRSRSRVVRVRVCPRRTGRAVLELRRSRRVLARKRVSLRAGRAKTVRLRLSRKARRALGRRKPVVRLRYR